MLRKEMRHTRDARAPRQLVKRRVPFPQRDDLLLVVKRRQQIAVAPNAALIYWARREAAFLPHRLQLCPVRLLFVPGGIGDFEQVSTLTAAKVLARSITEITASNATKAEVFLAHTRGGSGDQ